MKPDGVALDKLTFMDTDQEDTVTAVIPNDYGIDLNGAPLSLDHGTMLRRTL